MVAMADCTMRRIRKSQLLMKPGGAEAAMSYADSWPTSQAL